VKKKAKKLEEVTVEQTVKQIEERIRQGCERADKILEEARTTFEDAEKTLGRAKSNLEIAEGYYHRAKVSLIISILVLAFAFLIFVGGF